MQRIKEWSWRYVPAEIFGIVGAVAGASVVFLYVQDGILAAYAGVIGENLGFYGYIFLGDLRKKRKENAQKNKKFSWAEFKIVIQNLFLEFGFSEVLDSLLVRPVCLFWFSRWVPEYGLGIITGKIAADIVFYGPTIFAYEMKKKYLKD